MIRQSAYENALKLERDGQFDLALAQFKQLMSSSDFDHGDILFHCGWSIEQKAEKDDNEALHYYQEAFKIVKNRNTRMNSAFRSGWLFMHQKNFSLSADWFKKAIDQYIAGEADAVIYHDALYWYSVSLEAQGLYLEAIIWHHVVQKESLRLNPESRFREIYCLNQIGAFEDAMKLCKSFKGPLPQKFDNKRYLELQGLAKQEYKFIEACLSDNYLSDEGN